MNAENSEIKSRAEENRYFWRNLARPTAVQSEDCRDVDATALTMDVEIGAGAERAHLENQACRALWLHRIEPLQNENQQLR